MKAFHSHTAALVVLLALSAASSLRAGPGVDYWMRKHVFVSQAKTAAATADLAVSTESAKTVEVTRIDHAYRGVPHQVVVQVSAQTTTAPTAVAVSEKPVEDTRSASRTSSSSAVIH